LWLGEDGSFVIKKYELPNSSRLHHHRRRPPPQTITVVMTVQLAGQYVPHNDAGWKPREIQCLARPDAVGRHHHHYYGGDNSSLHCLL
jgi:hypothetical protein